MPYTFYLYNDISNNNNNQYNHNRNVNKNVKMPIKLSIEMPMKMSIEMSAENPILDDGKRLQACLKRLELQFRAKLKMKGVWGKRLGTAGGAIGFQWHGLSMSFHVNRRDDFVIPCHSMSTMIRFPCFSVSFHVSHVIPCHSMSNHGSKV